MKEKVFILTLCSILMASLSFAVNPNIIGTDIKIINNNIMVDISITNTVELEASIKSGIKQEIIFTVELLRFWRFWPDEFVVSKKIKKTIKYDNLRDQYRASSRDGINRVEKLFKDYNKMKDWIFNIKAINLANIKELVPGKYYIRTIVESKNINQLPLIGFLIHLIPEVEISLAKESPPFLLRTINEKP